jgi:hypothetical protein
MELRHGQIRASRRRRFARSDGLRPDPADSGCGIRSAAGGLQPAGHAPRRVGRLRHGRRPRRAAGGLDRAGALQLLKALAAEQSGRGGRTRILERRDEIAGISAESVADLERLHQAVGESIAYHKYLGATLPTKRRQGLDWTLGEDAVKFGKATGMDYALFLHAEDSFASTGRVALQVIGLAGCIVGFCAPQGGGGQSAYASLVDLHTGDVVWFNVLRTQSLAPGIGFGDIRTPQGAAQMVDRLLGRMKAGRNVRARTGDSR